jgi:hypothetical protein
LAVNGAATPTSVAYATAGVEMEYGDMVTIEVTPKTGDKQTSPEIVVVKPKDTYTPKQTLYVLDFDAAFSVTPGDKATECTHGTKPGFFGQAYEVQAASGNGWNGIYLKIENDNGGSGFDLSAYNKPHITFLVNTKGGEGYVQPIITADGSTNDRHLTGAFGYGDDYKVKTNTWEWRSYDLEKMGFPVVKGKLDKIGIQFRGGNVNGTPFYIIVDQVMITDGPLTPSLVWDAEAAGGGDLPITFNGGSGLTGYTQGENYATYKYTVGSDTWAWLGNIMQVGNLALDPTLYANGIYINYMVNTGASEGYTGIQVEQDGNKAADQKGDSNYGDNYKFRPTNGKWEWRSTKFDVMKMDNWAGSNDKIDLSKPFNLSVYARGGNVATGTNAELHLDYYIFTTVPLDPSLLLEE